VFLAMKWKQSASMRFRNISSAMKVLLNEEKIDRAPSHETCIQWDLKIGLHKLNRPKETSSDWCWIVDHVIAQGSTKCLAIMGVRCDVLKHRNNWTISLQDLEPFGLIPMRRSTGEEVSKALQRVSKRTGVVPTSIISDRGSDLWLGIKEFQKFVGDRVVTLYDVCHKIAIEYEKLFENDPDWGVFKEKANYLKKQLHCTTGIAFAPPAQRRKARYHNVDIIISWAVKILQHDGKWDEKVYEKIKWVYDYERQIITWSQWVEIGKHIRDQVRQSGFGPNTENLIIDRLSLLPMVESSHQLACSLLDFVSKESSQLQFGESAPGTTEVIESLFGYFKHVKNGLWDEQGGIGRLILTMASRVGELTSELVRGALNNIQQRELAQWFHSCRCAEVL
jgi:hypothetical protein